METLRVIVRLVSRAGSETVVREALAALVEPVRREPGCLNYDIYESNSAPNVFFDVADWAGAAAMDAHSTTPHVRNALAVLEPHLAEALQVDVLRPL